MPSTPPISLLRRRIALAFTATICACAFVPSLAKAADFCVNDDACVQGGGWPYVKLEYALKAADAIPTGDRIFVGPGTYVAPDTTGFSALTYPVEIIGAGKDKTVLTGPTNTTTVLRTAEPSSAVSNLQIVVPDANDGLGKSGLEMTGGRASGLLITSSAGAAKAIGADIHGTLLEDSQVTLPQRSDMTAVMADTDSAIRGVDATAGIGIEMFGYDIHIDRARVSTNGIGIWAGRLGGVVSNSLIRLTSAGTGIHASTGHLSADVGLTARNVTVVGDGGASTGIEADSYVAKTATVIVDSTIIRGVKYPLTRQAAVPGTALLGVAYSDYDPFSVVDTGPGAFAAGEGNTNSNPLLAGPDDFHLLAGSPAIDAGNAAATADTTDLDGNPRVAGGRRDMGAYEAQPVVAPDPAPAADPGPATSAPAPTSSVVKDVRAPTIAGLRMTPARFKARRGAHIRFTLGAAASVRITIKRLTAHTGRYSRFATLRRAEAAGLARIAIKRRVGRAMLRAGRYIAVVTATDPAGNHSRAYQLKFRVLPA